MEMEKLTSKSLHPLFHKFDCFIILFLLIYYKVGNAVNNTQSTIEISPSISIASHHSCCSLSSDLAK